jgi:arginyl-tRNA synthetase
LNDEDIYYKKPNDFILNIENEDDSSYWIPKKSKDNVVVEFSSPNIAKPLHAGHMRSTFHGNFLSIIHKKFGHEVTKINYLGDWGTQYGLLAVGFQKFGSIEKLKESPIKHMLDVYVKANADESLRSKALFYFKEMEENKEEFIQMWKYFKELSIKELVDVYAVRFYIFFFY